MGKDNYHQFRENRHDQTILSLLIKKYRQANSGSPQTSANELKNIKPIIMPHILCIYRKTYFNDYEDLKKKCKQFIKVQEYQFI